MTQAIWNGAVIAESDKCETVEKNAYFPPASVNRQYFRDSNKTTICPWKGLASYYHLEVDGALNEDAAWTYPEPKEKARHIRDYVAFWKGVEIAE